MCLTRLIAQHTVMKKVHTCQYHHQTGTKWGWRDRISWKNMLQFTLLITSTSWIPSMMTTVTLSFVYSSLILFLIFSLAILLYSLSMSFRHPFHLFSFLRWCCVFPNTSFSIASVGIQLATVGFTVAIKFMLLRKTPPIRRKR